MYVRIERDGDRAVVAQSDVPYARPDYVRSPRAVPTDWASLLSQYNWPVEQAERVLMCESSGDPSAVSPDGQNIGLFQINLVHIGKLRGGESLLDPVVNVRIAYQIWADQGWGPWSCRP